MRKPRRPRLLALAVLVAVGLVAVGITSAAASRGRPAPQAVPPVVIEDDPTPPPPPPEKKAAAEAAADLPRDGTPPDVHTHPDEKPDPIVDENDPDTWMCVSGDLIYIHMAHVSVDVLLAMRESVLEERETDPTYVPTPTYEAVPLDCEPTAGMSSLEEFHRARSALAVLNDDGSVKSEDTIRSEAGS